MKKFPYFQQPDQMDCGPTCLRMIAKYYGKHFSIQRLRDACRINKEGVSLLGISEAAEDLGFRTLGGKISMEQLSEIELPAILHWKQNHFVVLYRIKAGRFLIADPASGLIELTRADFIKNWLAINRAEDQLGIVLILETTSVFFRSISDPVESSRFVYFLGYIRKYKQLIFQLFLALTATSILQLFVPLLTQLIVDVGIAEKNLSFLYLVLLAQVMLFVGKTTIEFIRSWILLHVSTRVNVAILTDFLIKLMRLPVSFYNSKMTGDIIQRMNDQKRIESFITGSTLSTIFSLFNLLFFAIILCIYQSNVLFILGIASILYGIWIIIFLNRRRYLDYLKFDLSAKNQNQMVQIVQGMQEIKLNACETPKRWAWERLQASIFKLNVKGLSLSQLQQAGAVFINEGKNIFITFFVAKSVIDGHLTLGGMMAIQYIVGQISSPIDQLLGFIQQYQDAKISMERLEEIQKMDDEEPSEKKYKYVLPLEKDIQLNMVSFKYPGSGNDYVLKDVNLNIPQGKTTAIVGMSGSGKTSILKLLLRFYQPESGVINVGQSSIESISHSYWRKSCGVVMQDGYIFSDTIARNIAVADEEPNSDKLWHAIKVANIGAFVSNLPLGLDTIIGAEGNDISQGQKQRLLIARAVYKNPEYIFFDEATNALDATNEYTIMENLKSFFKGKTVVIVAHRLSTVRNADQIVVMMNGKIQEVGSHQYLCNEKGAYWELVKNQMELTA